jgi:hypothetical protein
MLPNTIITNIAKTPISGEIMSGEIINNTNTGAGQTEKIITTGTIAT